jgi:hypothetical protein
LRKKAAQPIAQHEPELLVKRDQPIIKGGIMQAGQAQSVSWVQSFLCPAWGVMRFLQIGRPVRGYDFGLRGLRDLL